MKYYNAHILALCALMTLLPDAIFGARFWPLGGNGAAPAEGEEPAWQKPPPPYDVAEEEEGGVQEWHNLPVTKSHIQMPGVTAPENETYLCTSYTLNTDDTNFLVGFDPIADMSGVHHVLLFGCEAPGSEAPVWNCGEMSSTDEKVEKAPACTTQPNILYAWARNAPKLELPDGVGFRVGANTGNNYLVLQVHYMHATHKKDYSGVAVISTAVPQPRTAATVLLVTGGQIKPKSTEMLEAACLVEEPVEIHPFAFRVHTHRHGVKVSGWKVVENPTDGEDKWSLLGERDPQLPQLFESIRNASTVISQGDILAAQCVIKNAEDRTIKVGATGEDEMCNFYLMYWVEGDQTLSDNVCYSPGAPAYFWGRDAGLNHIPKH